MSYFPTITAAQISDATTSGRNILKNATPAGAIFIRVNNDGTISQLDAAGVANEITGGGGLASGTVSPVTSISITNGVLTSAS